MGDQFSALTSASNPAASSAHIVVNIASLPSTVTRVSGIFSHFTGGGGRFFCADAAAGSARHAQRSATKLLRLLIIFSLMSCPDLLCGDSRGPLNHINLQTFAAFSRRKFAFTQSTSAHWPSQETRVKGFANSCIRCAHLLKVRMHRVRYRMARPMPKSTRRFASFSFGLVLAVGIQVSSLRAQLVRDDGPPPASQIDNSKQQANPSAPSGKKRLSQDLALTGDSYWVDTNIDLQAGERAVITATGTMRYADAKDSNGPEGVPRGFKDLLRVLPFNGAGRGAVIARIGDADTAETLLIGAQRDVLAVAPGRLAIGLNQSTNDSADGSFSVHVEVYAAESGASGTMHFVAQQVKSLPGIDNSLFTKIPRRIADKDGNPGDMVNFLILGSEDGMQRLFTTAGWVKVDADVKDTVLHGIIGSLSKEAYLTMPMSQLYLFGRAQDYGWAHAEPISVVASRNHLRIWKTPFDVNGQTLWVGAATHDVGFEKDQRNNGITHKIDPNIDLERDYVEKTLISTGLVDEVTHILPANPMQEAKTATGGSFHSNGQVLVLKLGESPHKQ